MAVQRPNIAQRLRGLAGWVRVQRGISRWLGPQFRRSVNRIELDLTWACNLKCHNCNRSCTQSPTGERLEVRDIEKFVDDSIGAGVRWDRIRLLGGEPTLHPELSLILHHLNRYRAFCSDTLVQICSNGHGTHVQGVLDKLPHWLVIENTMKTTIDQPFLAFNVAPVDRRMYRYADFRNACWVASYCGMALTPRGYHPCAVAGGIERVSNRGHGRKQLPSERDGMEDILLESCAMCGGFDRVARTTVDKPVMSRSWRRMYADEHRRGQDA